MEQLYSPLIVSTTPEHEELKVIAADCITRHHAYHYLGFAKNQWRLFKRENPPRVKPLLYLYRVLLTGIYLMQTGRIEANLTNLNRQFNLSYIPKLIALKVSGTEKERIRNIDLEFYQQEYVRLREKLLLAFKDSHLPDDSNAKAALNDLLVRIRLKHFKQD